MLGPSHSSRCYHPKNIGRGVQIIKLLMMPIFPLPCYSVPLRSKYSPQSFIIKHHQPTSVIVITKITSESIFCYLIRKPNTATILISFIPSDILITLPIIKQLPIFTLKVCKIHTHEIPSYMFRRSTSIIRE